jgi:hypothetical protein
MASLRFAVFHELKNDPFEKSSFDIDHKRKACEFFNLKKFIIF